MDIKTFRNLPVQEIAQQVRESGTRVCAFPVKGTRRWFMMEHPIPTKESYAASYLQAVFKQHIAVYKLCFEHGIETLLTPSFALSLMQRGEAYMQMAAHGLAALAQNEDFLEFYKTLGIRVRFYGEYRKFLADTPYQYLLELFDDLTERTLAHQRHQLLFGLFVHDATETIVNLSVQHYQRCGEIPDKRALIKAYYGEALESVDLFIGFSKLRAFDMPLLFSGKTDLYFTVSPSLYLTAVQLRDILYDHLYMRRLSSQVDYATLSDSEQERMKTFYTENIGRTIGVGAWHNRWRFWYPLPQVNLPSGKVSLAKE